MPEDSHLRDMPEAEGADYIISAFHRAGVASHGANGAIPLPWSELVAFGQVNSLDGWEVSQMQMMSRAYCSMLHAAEEDIPPPGMDIDDYANARKQEAVASMMAIKSQRRKAR